MVCGHHDSRGGRWADSIWEPGLARSPRSGPRRSFGSTAAWSGFTGSTMKGRSSALKRRCSSTPIASWRTGGSPIASGRITTSCGRSSAPRKRLRRWTGLAPALPPMIRASPPLAPGAAGQLKGQPRQGSDATGPTNRKTRSGIRMRACGLGQNPGHTRPGVKGLPPRAAKPVLATIRGWMLRGDPRRADRVRWHRVRPGDGDGDPLTRRVSPAETDLGWQRR